MSKNKIVFTTKAFSHTWGDIGKIIVAQSAVALIGGLTKYALEFWLNKHKNIEDLKQKDGKEIVQEFLKSNPGIRATNQAIDNSAQGINDLITEGIMTNARNRVSGTGFTIVEDINGKSKNAVAKFKQVENGKLKNYVIVPK